MSVIRNPGAVYRSTNPDHLAITRANEATRSAAITLAEQVANELVPGSTVYGVVYDSGAFGVSGVSVEHGDAVDVPVGMRWDTKAKGGARVLVPAMRTEEGKALSKRLSALGFTPQSLGEVSKIMTITDGTRRWFSSAVIEVIGDQVYATYFHPLDDRRYGERPSDRDMVAGDPGWTEIPLSEFYAAREAVDA